MADKHTEQEASKQLPDPYSHDSPYIDIHVPRKNGKYEVVTFTKSHQGDKVVWIALPYAR